ncbi:MAG: helix-turn-helix domain-containing protein, partial [Thermoguttaceae bacterium]|nr:helix-turn-helix domain-containing protein [Thermoguttaceae bacterium]
MNRVKEFRERRGFAAEALAERVGVSERFLRALEADSSVASVEIGFKLAVALEAPFAELFGLEDAPGAEGVFGRVETPSKPKLTEVWEVCDDATAGGEFVGRVETAIGGDATAGGEFVGRVETAIGGDAALDGEFVGRVETAIGGDAAVGGEEADCVEVAACEDAAPD